MVWCSPKNMLLLLSVFLFGQVLTQDPGCDFFQNVAPGARYVIYSQNYPNSYNRPSTCRWQFQCASGYQCRLDCFLEMPQTTNCAGDRFLVSRYGDPQLNNADSYCGRGYLTGVVSVNQGLACGSLIPANSPGGRFTCNLTSQAITPPPQTCSCGVRKQNRIVGGTNAGPNEFPMMVGLIQKDSRPVQLICGAVIITVQNVLTAAHCLEGWPAASLQVVLGSSYKNQGQRYNVSSYTIHPSYNSNNYDYDIAILLIRGLINFNANVGPVCLPFKFVNTDLTGMNLTVLGWGTTSFGGPTSEILQKVDLRVISQQECMRSFAVTSRQICTYTRGKDSCQNDSGGPCLYTDTQTGRLFDFGIVSFGKSCAGASPGMNTRVPQLLDWIVRTAPGDYCSVP